MPDDAVPANVGEHRPISGLKLPHSFTLGSNLLENWKIFKQRWHTYSVLSHLSSQPREVQVALLLHTLADDALKVYNGFHFGTDENSRTVQEILDKFELFAVGEINETYERFMFNQRVQEEGEMFDKFLSDIRTLVKSCSYCDICLNSMLRDRIVLGIRDADVQTELLKVRNLTLEKCIDICKAAENASLKNKVLRPDNSVVHKVGYHKQSQIYSKSSDSDKGNVSHFEFRECKFCDKRHVFKKEKCPAYGKKCSKCGQENHFACKCPNSKSKKPLSVKSKSRPSAVCQIGDDSSSEGEWINNCTTTCGNKKDVKCLMLVGGEELVFQIDTGSSINALPVKYAKNVQKTNKILYNWNKSKSMPLGSCRRNIVNPKTNKKYSIEFVVFEGNLTPLIGYKASEQMGFVEVCENNFERVNKINVEDDYDDIMRGELGTLSGSQHLKVKDNVHPVIMPSRRTPISLRPKLKVELGRLASLGVIVPVEEPTPWVSQLVIASKKNGDIRICLDPKELNKALLREHYTLPILEDTLHELGQSRVFSKADLCSGYWHVVLDEPSSLLTTFQTCFGRYRWLRLPFGLSVSSEIFQKRILECLADLDGVVCIADDIIIHGKTLEEHDRNFEAFLKRCREQNIVLNKDKVVLRTDTITFMGHLITKDGLQSDPEKMKAISTFPVPQKIEELRRFLGMVNYVSKFLPHVTDILHPLYNLLKKDVKWTWSENQHNAFETVKDMIVNSPVLSYYDPVKELTLENDASEYGLGTALMQEGKPIAFASRALSSAERNYAQIEKEMLAILYGLNKFHHFTFGRSVRVVTDHKPLVSIVKKPLSSAPKRLQAMLLRAQEYNFEIEYKSGKDIPVADALSRAPTSVSVSEEVVAVNNLSFTPLKPSRLDEIRVSTNADNTLKLLKNTIMEGWPENKFLLPTPLTPYYNYRDELTVQDGIILRGERVVIPTSMRFEMKQKVHAGHSGINSCLRRARELIYWPGISAEIRQYVESCDVCSSYSIRQPEEPLFMHEVPSRPWEKIGTDIFTLSGRHYLITVDYFSQFFEIDHLPEITSEVVITKLKHHFARHGIPDTVISDNGPQFSSNDFALFSKLWGFSHEPISPGNSKANGAAEAAVKIAKNIMKKCRKAKEDPYLGILNLRNTPQEGMNTSPVQRLMGRRTKTFLPTISERLMPSTSFMEKDKWNMEERRNKVAERHLGRKTLKPLTVGDFVRMQPIQDRKGEWKEGVVSKKLKSRSYEVATEDGKSYRRNRKFLRASVESCKQPLEIQRSAPLSISEPPERSTENNDNSDLINVHSDGNIHFSPVMRSDTCEVQTRSGRVSKAPDRLNL